MPVPSAIPGIVTFNGGQMTDLPVFTGTSFDGTELFEIVAPGNAAQGTNYSITSLLLATLLASLRAGQVVIGQGQNMTSLTAFPIPAGISKVYVNKPTPEPTYVTFGAANLQLTDVLVKDVAGTLDNAGNGIFTTVTADGFVNPTIIVPYGGYWFRPVTSLNIWTLGPP